MLLNTEDNKFKYLIFNIIDSNVYFLYRKVIFFLKLWE